VNGIADDKFEPRDYCKTNTTDTGDHEKSWRLNLEKMTQFMLVVIGGHVMSSM
jgi:hypothetical protein